ncbi:MAG TPA: response regulator [Firmicutes bacterium]|jgi:DNA-binding NarL/FixJ family response regulator|nr:response regulator [Bacillota bacterium]
MKANILVVDKELDFTADLQTELEKKKYEVSIADNKLQAQEIVRIKKPDFIVLGVISPRGDAFQLHQWLKKSPVTGTIPIIVVDVPPEKQLLSGWRRDEGIRLEVEDYYSRPLKTAILATAIEKLLDEATKKIKVLIADDHAVVREGICALLNLHKDIVIVGEAINGKDAIDKTLQLLPDVVLMDIAMPVMNGIEAMKHIAHKCKEVKVLVLSQYDDEGNIAASKQAGAFGFIPKKSVSSQLLEAIRAAS